MEYNMPHHISNEKDLKAYEDFLECDNTSNQNSLAELGISKSDKTEYKMQVESRRPYLKASRNIVPDTLANPVFFQGYLKNHIGKLIRVESLIGDCLESRIGKLLEVGVDYIVIKLYKSYCSMMINAANIKYITIVHDNDISKTLIQ